MKQKHFCGRLKKIKTGSGKHKFKIRGVLMHGQRVIPETLQKKNVEKIPYWTFGNRKYESAYAVLCVLVEHG